MSYAAYKIVCTLVLITLIVWAYWLGTEVGEKEYRYERGEREWNMMERKMQKGDSSWQDTMMRMDMTHDAMSMSMNDMGKMLEGKTGDELDRAFLEGMIPHHQAAVDMAKYIAGSSRPELVKLWGEIIAAQMKEIEQMKAWQIAWGYTSTGMTASGMMMSGMHMMPDGTMMQM